MGRVFVMGVKKCVHNFDNIDSCSLVKLRRKCKRTA